MRESYHELSAGLFSRYEDQSIKINDLLKEMQESLAVKDKYLSIKNEYQVIKAPTVSNELKYSDNINVLNDEIQSLKDSAEHERPNRFLSCWMKALRKIVVLSMWIEFKVALNLTRSILPMKRASRYSKILICLSSRERLLL